MIVAANTNLQQQIDAVLLIHRPCHTADTQPWDCNRHACPGCGRPTQFDQAVCVECSYDDRDIPYPCPTARTLGVPAPEESKTS